MEIHHKFDACNTLKINILGKKIGTFILKELEKFMKFFKLEIKILIQNP